MPVGQGWRAILVAYLLTVILGQAEFSNDLRRGYADSRTGDIEDIENESEESKANEDALEELASDNRISVNQEYQPSDTNDPSLNDQEKSGPGFSPGSSPSGLQDDPNVVIDNKDKSTLRELPDPAMKIYQGVHPNVLQYPGDPVIHDDVVFPKDHEQENEYPLSAVNEADQQPSQSLRQGLFSKLIPIERHILLTKIPGAQNVIQCSKEGELHNFWAPSFQCMVCVCLSSYGRLRPVCVSCNTCLSPPGPRPSPGPSTISYITVAPPQPPSPIPSPEEVSCKPLPTNEPFQSPLDPCKLCICTETVNEWGLLNANINCHHNPQCVLPPYSTPGPPNPTPIPAPVCNEFPQNVPFPHPDDSCTLCKCVVKPTHYGVLEQHIDCFVNPDCQPTVQPETELPEPITEIPGPSPDPEICSRYPDNMIFPHPLDPCQVCKCMVHPSLFSDKKKITCYMRPNCRPTQRPITVEPITEITIGPEPDCEGYPENLMFPHPTDPCKICKCVPETNFFNRDKRLMCYLKPDCIPNPRPRPSTTEYPWPAPTSTLAPLPPQPDNVRCAPLPTGIPFPNPMNPCQVCVCTERADVFGRLDVNIDCQENHQCVLPDDRTVLPPDIITPIPLPICKKFPENVYFPHPRDACKVCKCSLMNTPYGVPQHHIYCTITPDCAPTESPTPAPPVIVITQRPEPDYLCDRYPLDIIFPHPSDNCQVCTCYQNQYQKTIHLSCVLKPECKPTPSPPSPSPEFDDVSCKPLPSGTPFQNPLNPCQICVCTERADLFGRPEATIECQENPECVLPPNHSTLSPDIIQPIPLPACKQFPENVLFPHPQDSCKLCKCTVERDPIYGQPKEIISCIVRPECLPTPGPEPYTPDIPTEKPIIVPPPTPPPSPETVSCAPFPTGSPFQNPLNPCQVCMCTERADLFGRHDVTIECEENPDCVLPPNVSTLPPIVSTPIPLPACKEFPENVLFPHPQDACQVCKCTVELKVPYGQPEEVISCTMKPECFPTPAPITEYPEPWPTPGPEPPIEFCVFYPENTPFDDPTDPCKVCTCVNNSPGSALSIVAQGTQIHCVLKPECFPQPSTEESGPYGLCEFRPMNVPFTHPNDPCQTCMCFLQNQYSDAIGHSLAPQHPALMAYHHCTLKPECAPPPPEPMVTSTPVPIIPTPAPNDVSCKPLPSGKPFQNPLNPCQICVCKETVDVFGRPDVNIKCQENPHCVIPPDATTIPPTPITPVPLPACAKFPTNVVFPHPRDACQLCKCTVAITAWGVPEQHISCVNNPECEPSPPSPTTPIPPEPSVCDRYPPNALFPLPQDPCRLCKCTMEKTPFGVTKQQLNCFTNPACSPTPAPITPAPRPPGPPGPLPGPAPHESCSPYIPNKPFEHPWDECQVCVCKEAITTERITVEINCYTKPSCCIDPPFETPGLPGHHGYPVTPGSQGGSESYVNGPGSFKIEESVNGILNPKFRGYVNAIDTSGGNLNEFASEAMIDTSSGNFQSRGLIRPNLISSEQWLGSTGGYKTGPSHGNLLGPVSVGSLYGPSSGENWIENSGGNTYGSGTNWMGNIIGPSSSFIRPSGTFMGPYTRPGGHLYLPNSGNIFNKSPIGSPGSGYWRQNQDMVKPGQIIASPTQQHRYLPVNVGRPLLGSGGVGLQLGLREGGEKAQMDAKADGIVQAAFANAQAAPSTARRKSSSIMRTKSARPRDPDSAADYD